MTSTAHKNHPARDQSFLSRLHDGDLAPSERAHFETHRAHCNECRRLAAEYEHALSMFRTARSAPAPADMASRVLRKVQAAGRPRTAPPSFFSVDWRWASGFAVALLVLLVAAPALLRQQNRASETTAPIPVALEQRAPRSDAAPNVPSVQNERAPKDAEEPKLKADVRSAPADQSSPASRAPQVLRAAPQSAGAQVQAQAQAQAPAREAAAKDPDRQRNVAQNQAAAFSERPGDKVAASPAPAAPSAAVAGALRDEEERTEKTLDQASRLIVQEADGLGSAPRLLSGADQPALAQLRGHSFVVLVDPSGSVSDVSDVSEAVKQESTSDLKRRQAAVSKEKDAAALSAAASEPLKRLQFARSDRARRVLLRVQ
jgi:hypothetical protein